jgi:hypothetical protein
METEKHYSVSEVAAMWGLSDDSIRRLFAKEPGVLVIGSEERLHKRKRKTLRIPESVLKRVHAKHQTKKPGH